jgi:hypothetical protein
MTLSKESRYKNIEFAILKYMEQIGGLSVFEVYLRDEKNADILPTTWEKLKRLGLLVEHSRGLYRLSGPGWLVGSRLLGQLDTEDIRANLGKLCAALKGKVKGRRAPGFTDVDELVKETGLSAGFIRNAIEANLIQVLFGVQGAEWISPLERGKSIRIPVGFNIEPLS